MSHFLKVLALLSLLIVGIPSVAFAQASISGVVKDTSNAVLPGVTVEAASPALIEKVRTAVTDGAGQFTIVDLRPGTYTVTFTLVGFSTFRRDGVTLTGTFNGTVNAELKVGAIEETITVTGETPIVDVQGVKQQRIINHDIVDAIPTGRSPTNIAALIPGLTAAGGAGGGITQDVGGALGDVMVQLTAHGGRVNDERVTFDGLEIHNDANGGAYTSFQPNMSGMQEVTVDSAGAGADQSTGGVRMNLIPKDGGNFFKGTVFVGGENASMQGNNFTQDLKDRGLLTADSIKYGYDINPAFGGPIKKDTLWFYVGVRKNSQVNYVGGIFNDLNSGNPNAWKYEPDLNHPGVAPQEFYGGNVRLTWQATSKHKFTVYQDNQYRCQCPRLSSSATPDAATPFRVPLQRTTQLTWTAPVTSRLLLEAAIGERSERWRQENGGLYELPQSLIGVTEQSTSISFRSQISSRNDQLYNLTSMRGSLSYVTGSHAFKVGFTDIISADHIYIPQQNAANLLFRFNGSPNQLTELAYPLTREDDLNDFGIFAQDKWITGKVTLSLGIRYENLRSSFASATAGPSLLTPNRNITFPETDWVNWKDVLPRMGLSYDLFGNGKTAIKTTLNKYNLTVIATPGNPITTLSSSVTRTWTDKNNNFVPDCNLLNPASQTVVGGDFCGQMSDVNFGNTTQTTKYDPATLRGWNARPSNWEFSTSVQQELARSVSVSIGYYRRWFNKFIFTQNQSVTAADYSPYTVTAPADSRLPGGGGYTVTGFDLNPDKVGQINNLVTFADEHGGWTEHWDGVDVAIVSRLQHGILLQGGVSTGRNSTNFCGLAEQYPAFLLGAVGATAMTTGLPTLGLNEAGVWIPKEYCAESTGFLTQIKGFGSYAIPKIDVQTSASFQSIPGPAIAANFIAPSALVAPSLGRPLSGNAPNTTINLVSPGSMYGERLNQLDLRFSKILRYGRTRTNINFDLYNALNANAVQVQNNSYAVWQTPQRIILARFLKISAQFDF